MMSRAKKRRTQTSQGVTLGKVETVCDAPARRVVRRARAEQGLELPVEMRLVVVAVGEGEIGPALRMTDRE